MRKVGMRKVGYLVGGHTMGCHDAAILVGDEDPREALVESVIETISTDIEITCGGYTMHLAAWRDPEHWSDDWEAKGVAPEDVDGIVAAAVSEDAL